MTIALTVLAGAIGLVVLFFLADAWTRHRIRRLQRQGLAESIRPWRRED